MSRMTKFLNQKCAVSPYQLDEQGEPQVNQFGELEYLPSVMCKCRHEISFQDIQVSNGSVVKSTARYFLDDTQEVKADYLIDGRAVLSVISYVNALGKVEGYEVYV